MDIRFDPGVGLSTVSAVQPVAPVPSSRGDEPSDQEPDDASHTQAALQRAVTQLQDHVQSVHRELRFRVDETTGQTVVRVVEKETGRLIRQVPNQNVLDLNDFLQSISGLLLREQA